MNSSKEKKKTVSFDDKKNRSKTRKQRILDETYSTIHCVKFRNDLHYTETFSLVTIEEIQQRCREIISRYDEVEKNLDKSIDQ